MKIKGLQKLTLIDYPGKLACTVFLFGCNFRCGFCHNPELVLDSEFVEDVSLEEILVFLEKRKGQLEGVCFTGGEPLATLEKDFVRAIKEMGYSVKIDTNGSFPSRLKEFIDKKLVDYVAMDLKGSFENYSAVAGVPVEIGKIKESLELIFSSGIDYEFRTTIVPRLHNESEMESLWRNLFFLLGGKPKRYFLQAFENSGKFVDMNYKTEKNVDEKFLEKLKSIADNYFEEVGIRA